MTELKPKNAAIWQTLGTIYLQLARRTKQKKPWMRWIKSRTESKDIMSDQVQQQQINIELGEKKRRVFIPTLQLLRILQLNLSSISRVFCRVSRKQKCMHALL